MASGPYWRQKGEAPSDEAPDPVCITVPSASTTSSPSTESDTAPFWVEPRKKLPWDRAPPTVALYPDIGPK